MKSTLTVYLFFAVILVCFTCCLSSDLPYESGLLTKYKHTLQNILHEVFHKDEPTELQNREDIKAIMVELTGKLRSEVEILTDLHAEKRAVQSTKLLWLLDSELRLQVEAIQLKINDHVRDIEGTIDKLNFLWMEIKPSYGLFSKMFLAEAFQFVPWLSGLVLYVVEATLVFDVVTLIIFGPVAAFSVFMWAFIGSNFLGSLIKVVIFLGLMYWIFHLPNIMIQYDPTLFEFLIVYTPIVATFLGVSVLLFRRPRGTLVQTRKTVKIQ
eukprot:TRINITY_DN8047_c0_g1_i1.p1 TRINITY_DN8047_c0_g1~~TRINITY_DN8047_c0_g1_i1.p1  ORF type:complete len:268 (+),score=16.35 TRINITY_DN8047_c0_g1_i1:2-805(+)